jgi:hypothetical protein
MPFRAGGPRSDHSLSIVTARVRGADERGWQHALTRVGEIGRRHEMPVLAD